MFLEKKSHFISDFGSSNLGLPRRTRKVIDLDSNLNYLIAIAIVGRKLVILKLKLETYLKNKCT